MTYFGLCLSRIKWVSNPVRSPVDTYSNLYMTTECVEVSVQLNVKYDNCYVFALQLITPLADKPRL